MKMLVYFAVLIGSASAAKYCCAPNQWEGTAEVVMLIWGGGSIHQLDGKMYQSYDEVNQMVVYDQDILYDNARLRQRIIHDNRENATYLFNDQGCSRLEPLIWIPSCIPDNAVEGLAAARHGFGTNSVVMKNFMFKIGTSEINAYINAENCLPFNLAITGDFSVLAGPGTQFIMESITYTNITLGIKDKNVFFVPSSCKASTLVVG